jgi:hypothetical protein
MESTLAVVFSALMFAGSGSAPGQTPAASPMDVPAQLSCSVWYEECYYCGEPGWWTCDYRCTVCEGWTEPVCEPTGWVCNAVSRDRFSSLFAPAATARPLSCKS